MVRHKNVVATMVQTLVGQAWLRVYMQPWGAHSFGPREQPWQMFCVGDVAAGTRNVWQQLAAATAERRCIYCDAGMQTDCKCPPPLLNNHCATAALPNQ